MKGVRGWALLAGVALTAVAVWQVVLYTGAPGPGGTAAEWLQFIGDTPIVGKTWGARVAALLLAVVPLRVFGERSRGSWGFAARGFLFVWLPLVFIGALLQTQSIERLRDLSSELGSDSMLVMFTSWHALVEPFTRTSAVMGVVAFSLLLASVGGKSPFLGILLLLVMGTLVIVAWSPMLEAVVAVVQGVLLAILAFAAPGEPDHGSLRRP